MWRPHSAACRQTLPRILKHASGWSLFRGKSPKDPVHVEEVTQTEDSPEVILERIARDHIDTGGSWKTASLSEDLDIKGKILCSFERTFNQSIPNDKLSSINTFTHLLDLLESPPQDELQLRTNTFPNIKNDGTLPPNLSIQFINTAPRPRPNRSLFQNYDSRRPEHANYLTKEEKERRKKKRRHLTAWK